MKLLKTKLFLLLSIFTFTLQAEPTFRLGELVIKSDQAEKFKVAADKNIKTSVSTEKDLLAMYAMPKEEQPNDFYVVEIYTRPEGKTFHNQTEQFNEFSSTAKQMIDKSQLFDVVPTFISESKEPFKLDGNYVIRFQSLTADAKNFDKIKNVLEKYRSQKQLASQGVLAVYAINLKEDKGQWKIIEIYKDKPSFDKHHESSQYKAYRTELKPLLLEL